MILLAEWHLTIEYLDRDTLNNPIPRYFTPKPAIVKAAITNEPAKAFKDI
jgi:hypothetical protein